MKRLDRGTLIQAAVLLIAGIAAWPLFSEPGLLNTRGGGDSPFLLQRLHQLVVALGDGHFPVRWMADANYGSGYPFYNFYAPLSLYVGAFFRTLGYSYVQAIKLAQLSGFLLAAWGMYHLARRWLGSPAAGLLAAAAYTLAPFHMVNVYVRGDSLAEFWAMALYPVVLLAADNAVHRPAFRSLLLLALAYGALVLSHNISALIFTPFLLLYLGLALWRRHQSGLAPRRAGFLIVAGGLLLGLALSAWFWLPALGETALVQTEPVTAGYFHYQNHFLDRPVQDTWLFSYEVAGREAFRMGLAQLLLLLPGLLTALYLLLRLAKRKSPVTRFTPNAAGVGAVPLLFTLIMFGLATLMLTALSGFLWRTLPLLPFTQFPWRFLSVQAVAASLLIGLLAVLPMRRLLVPIGLVLLLWSGLAGLNTDHLPLTDTEVSASELAGYEWFTANIGSTVSAEYLPQTVVPRPFTSSWLETGLRDEAHFLSGSGLATLTDRRTQQQSWQLDIESPQADLIIPTLYWAGWEATLDDRPVTLQPAPGSGAGTGAGTGMILASALPAGAHTLTLTLGRTPVRLAAELISAAAVLLTIFLMGYAWQLGAGGTLRLIIALGGALLLLAGLALIWQEPTYAAGTRTWDFAQMAYLHHAPDGIAFEHDIRLAHYEYDADTVTPGDELLVTLTWDSVAEQTGAEVFVELTSPAIHRLPYAPVLASATDVLAPGERTLLVTIPENAPGGLYIPRLTIDGIAALTPSGQARGDLFLSPIRVLAMEQPSDSLRSLDLTVRDVVLHGPMPERLPVDRRLPADSPPLPPSPCEDAAGSLTAQLAWHTDRYLTQNYNVSLRLADAEGRELMICDSQPGHGFRPSSLWPPGWVVEDWLGMPLPAQLPASAPYILSARLYDVTTGQPLLTRRLGSLDWIDDRLLFQPLQPSFTLPDDITPAEVVYGDTVILHGSRQEPEEERLRIELFWGALAPIEEDYLRFVHLIDPVSGEIVSQWDGTPQNESYPTSQWSTGEVITDIVTLDLSDVPAGVYQIAVGLYQNTPNYPRLPALAADGRRLADDRFFIARDLSLP